MMKNWIPGACLVTAFTLPSWAQLPQAQQQQDQSPPQESMRTWPRQSSAMAEVSRNLMVDPKLEQ